MAGNKQFFHINAATAGQLVSGNSGAILGSLMINTPANAATSSVLTLFDGTSTAGKVIGVYNMQATAIPSWELNSVCAIGIFYSYVQTGAVTAVGDFTLTYQ